MTSSNTRTCHASDASLGLRRLLRRGRLALVLAWLALWLGGIGFAYGVVPSAQAGSGRNVGQNEVLDHGPAPHYHPSAWDDPDCRESRDASTGSPLAVPSRVSGDESASPALLPAVQPRVVRTDGRLAGHHSHLRPAGRALYLRILRLLI